MNPGREVLVGGAVAVAGDVIAAVGSSTELAGRHPEAEVIDATGCVVTPGMVNAHQHLTGDPLIRSCIPDLLPPGASIFEWSVPAHGAHTGDDDELSAVLSSVENLVNGVTTVVEAGTVANPHRAAAGMRRAGIRGTMGTWGWDIEEGPFTAPAAEVLDRQREVVDAFSGGGLIEGWVTLVGHDLASDELLAGAAELARDRSTGLTMHMSPTSSDPERYLARTGLRPLAHLDALGVLGPHLLVGHGVWLDHREMELVLSTSTAIAYCPWAYLRLGQGVAGQGRHAEIVERGGRVALGCDASNAGDTADILRTAALAAGLAPRHPSRSRALRRPHRVRAGHYLRGRGHRPGRPDRQPGAGQAGRHGGARHVVDRLGSAGGDDPASRVGNRRPVGAGRGGGRPARRPRRFVHHCRHCRPSR